MIETDNNNKSPLVSIIIATFQAAGQIGDCLNSIKNYAPQNTEIIIVDGGSKDATLSIIQKLGVTNFISEKDEGIYDALNKGIRRSHGKWLYFLGADDRLLEGFKQMTEKLKNPDTIYYGNTEPIYATDKKVPYHLLSGYFDKYRLAKYPVNHQAVLYPARVFYKNSYDLNYPVFADYALNLHLWGDENFQVKYYPITIASYNMTGFSATFTDEAFKKEKEFLIRKNLGLFTWMRYCFKRLKKRVKGEEWY